MKYNRAKCVMEAPKKGTEKVSDYANVLRIFTDFYNQYCWLYEALLAQKQQAYTLGVGLIR
jgi:hypothetical protein